MDDKNKNEGAGKTERTQPEGESPGGGEMTVEQERDALANALRFEQEKNKLLLDEVVALEDELVNRCLEEHGALLSDETREFWRAQLLRNRADATAALAELAKAAGKPGTETPAAGAGDGTARRPLHNRAQARPVVPPVAGGGGTSGGEDRAARIRNRAQELAAVERIPFSVAFRRAEREVGGH